LAANPLAAWSAWQSVLQKVLADLGKGESGRNDACAITFASVTYINETRHGKRRGTPEITARHAVAGQAAAGLGEKFSAQTENRAQNACKKCGDD
jgi:hypothetical protein